jgi:hypothetical protein
MAVTLEAAPGDARRSGGPPDVPQMVERFPDHPCDVLDLISAADARTGRRRRE